MKKQAKQHTKKQVIALAEKHDITVSFRYIPYNQWSTQTSAIWENYECYLDAPIGYWMCEQGLHCRLIAYPQITKAQAKESSRIYSDKTKKWEYKKGHVKPYLAKDFWNDVMEVLEECIEYNGRCECEDCVLALKEHHQQYLTNIYKINREAVE